MHKYLVDKEEFKMWMKGVLLDFKNGKGIVVNEIECEAAEAALERGEEVYCKVGNKLTGTKLILDKESNEIREVEI